MNHAVGFRTSVGRGRVRRAPWYFLILLAMAHATTLAQPAGGTPMSAVSSVLEIPFRIELGPLFRKAEDLLPREAGHWRDWRRESGIETRYRAWRGPLDLQLQGDLIQAVAHVRYWLLVRKRLLGALDLKASCGVDEPPRQAMIGVQMRIRWAPDWTLRPLFRVLPPRFIDRCEVTVLDIDVSPMIGRVFRRHMEEALRRTMAELSPQLEAARAQAAHYWQALQQPVELTPGVWLRANPIAVGLAPPLGGNGQLHTVLGLALAPAITVGEPGAVAASGLPPLQTFHPSGRGLVFDLALDLDLGALGAHLSDQLAGSAFDIEGRRIGLGEVRLAGEGARLRIDAALTGGFAGRVEIWAEPLFDPESQAIRLDGLEFIYTAADTSKSLMVDLFYQRIQAALEEGINGLLASRSNAMRDALERALARPLPEGLEIDLSQPNIQGLDFSMSDSTVRIRGTAGGSALVTFRP